MDIVLATHVHNPALALRNAGLCPDGSAWHADLEARFGWSGIDDDFCGEIELLGSLLHAGPQP